MGGKQQLLIDVTWNETFSAQGSFYARITILNQNRPKFDIKYNEEMYFCNSEQ